MKKTLFYKGIASLACLATVACESALCQTFDSLDHGISERLGWHIEKELQMKIKALPEGELLIGRTLILETGDKNIPFLISVPYEEIVLKKQLDFKNFGEAQKHHWNLNPQGMIWTH